MLPYKYSIIIVFLLLIKIILIFHDSLLFIYIINKLSCCRFIRLFIFTDLDQSRKTQSYTSILPKKRPTGLIHWRDLEVRPFNFPNTTWSKPDIHLNIFTFIFFNIKFNIYLPINGSLMICSYSY